MKPLEIRNWNYISLNRFSHNFCGPNWDFHLTKNINYCPLFFTLFFCSIILQIRHRCQVILLPEKVEHCFSEIPFLQTKFEMLSKTHTIFENLYKKKNSNIVMPIGPALGHIDLELQNVLEHLELKIWHYISLPRFWLNNIQNELGSI